jgi:hypothetical protein
VSRVIIGVDRHKLSATIEVLDPREQVLATGRFGTDRDGYRQMLTVAGRWPDRTWAVEGSHGIGRHVAKRLVADGEAVVDVPAKLSARPSPSTATWSRCGCSPTTALPEDFPGAKKIARLLDGAREAGWTATLSDLDPRTGTATVTVTKGEGSIRSEFIDGRAASEMAERVLDLIWPAEFR